MTMFNEFKRMFKTPTPMQMAVAELADVELELLKAETYVEYANSIVMYNTARAKRLRAHIEAGRCSPAQETKNVDL